MPITMPSEVDLMILEDFYNLKDSLILSLKVAVDQLFLTSWDKWSKHNSLNLILKL